MFELLLHAAHAHVLAAPAVSLTEHSGHATMAGQKNVPTHQLNLVGGTNEVYNSGPEPGGAPWSENSYDIRPTDSAGLAAEGGPTGPYTCDTDGFLCSIYNTQAYDDGVVPATKLLDMKHATPSEKAAAQAQAYKLYTVFGTGAESFHPKSLPNGSAPLPTGVSCNLAEDCNGI